MGVEVGKVINFGVTGWIKQEGIWKYLAAYFVFLLAIMLATLYFIAPATNPFLAASNNFADQMNSILHSVLFVAAISVVSLLVGSAFSYLFIAKALNASKKKFKEITVKKWLGFVVLQIAFCLSAVFSVFKLKKLLIGVFSLVLFIIALVLIAVGSGFSGVPAIAILGIILVIAAVILAVWYAVVVAKNFIKLAVSDVAYVEADRSVWDSLCLAWEKSTGNTANIFIAFLVVGIISCVIYLIFSAPASIYSATKTIAMVISGSTTGALLQFQLLGDPVYVGLSVISVIGQAIVTMISAFALVGVYNELTNKDTIVKSPKVATTKSVGIMAKRSFKKK